MIYFTPFVSTLVGFFVIDRKEFKTLTLENIIKNVTFMDVPWLLIEKSIYLHLIQMKLVSSLFINNLVIFG